MRELVADASVDAAELGRREVLSHLNEASNMGFGVRESQILRESSFAASQTTLSRLIGDALGSLGGAAEEGLGIVQAAERLRNHFTMASDFELQRIARTEINRAQQIAAVETEREFGIEYHEWITASDERVRASHALQHGEITRVGTPFSNGLLYPGDPAGPAEEVINCRCGVAPFIIPHGHIAPAEGGPFYESEIVAIGGGS